MLSENYSRLRTGFLQQVEEVDQENMIMDFVCIFILFIFVCAYFRISNLDSWQAETYDYGFWFKIRFVFVFCLRVLFSCCCCFLAYFGICHLDSRQAIFLGPLWVGFTWHREMSHLAWRLSRRRCSFAWGIRTHTRTTRVGPFSIQRERERGSKEEENSFSVFVTQILTGHF